MGCRGGELSGNEVGILATNKVFCEHIKNNWKHYTYWADNAKSFAIDQDGETLQVRDVLGIIEKAIDGSAAKTGLQAAYIDSTLSESKVTREYFISIIARAVYESPEKCPKAITKLLQNCRGAEP